jgi:Actin-like ATPase involved in cell division
VIHSIPRQFIIDGQGGIRNPIGMSGIKLEEEVHIVTGSSTVLYNIEK